MRALVLTGAPLLRTAAPAKPKLSYRVGRALHRRGLLSDTRMEALRQRDGAGDYRNASGVMRDVHVRLVNETYDAVIASVTCPVELVWGDDDTAAPLSVAEELARRLPNATLTVLPGAGHLTPLSAPDALREALLRHRP